MKRKDLEPGMVIETLNRNKFLIVIYENDLCVISLSGLFIGKLIDFDYQAICKIYSDYTLQERLWDSNELTQLSAEAIALLKWLPKRWKYIARNKDGVDDVWMYTYQPHIEKREDGSVCFEPEPISGHEGQRINRVFAEYFEDLPKGECYLIEDLIREEDDD